jgi:hypothetical protein
MGFFKNVIPDPIGNPCSTFKFYLGVLTSLFRKACPEPAEGRDKREILPPLFPRRLESISFLLSSPLVGED